MKCIKCGQEFIQPDKRTIVCGNCADDLRQEEDALIFGDEAFWPNKEAYEEELARDEADYIIRFRP